MPDYNTVWQDYPRCPYCFELDVEAQEVEHVWVDEALEELECPSCGREYECSTSVIWRFTTKKKGATDA